VIRVSGRDQRPDPDPVRLLPLTLPLVTVPVSAIMPPCTAPDPGL
jgi:hypothetical protein